MGWTDIFDIVEAIAPFVTSNSQRRNVQQAAQTNTANVEEFTAQAEQALYDAAMEADYLISVGEEKAAQAIIEGTKLGVAEIWRGAGLGAAEIKAAFARANKHLEPIIKQGRYADNEIASMLGIPNASGKLVPFDQSKLEETPGFQFQFDWGKRAVENSAIGNYLSGNTATELTKFGQGLAGTYFNDRITQLDTLGARGGQAAGQASVNEANMGSALGQLYGNAGNAAGTLYGNQGIALGQLYGTTGVNRAQLITQAESTLQNLNLGALIAQNTANTSMTNSTNEFLADLTQSLSGLSSLFGNKTNPVNTTQPLSIYTNSGLSNPIAVNNSAPNSDFFDDAEELFPGWS